MSTKYGQNFLLQSGVKKFVTYVNKFIPPKSLLIEIGPGTGNITKQLYKSHYLVGYEIDTSFISKLQGYNIIWKDFLKSNIQSRYFIGNLPFYCAKDILQLLDQLEFTTCIFIIGRYLYDRIKNIDNINYKVVLLDTISGKGYQPTCTMKTVVVMLSKNHAGI